MKYIMCVIMLLVSTISLADKSCVVTKVSDGDTIHANCDGKDTKIRLTYIDSYETKKNMRAYKQAYEHKITLEEVVARGKQAATYTKKELKPGQKIFVVQRIKDPVDRYGRVLGQVFINGVDINNKLLKEHPNVFLKY